MKKLVNYRPLVFAFIGALLGILLLAFCYYESKFNFIVILSIIGTMFFFAIILLFLQKKHNSVKYHLKNLFVIIISLILSFSFTCSVVGYKLNKADKVFNEVGIYNIETTVKAKICDISKNSYTFKKVSFNGIEYDNIKIQVNIELEDEYYNLTLGDTIVFNAVLFANIQKDDGLNAKLISNNIYYYGYCYDGEITKLSSTPNIFEKINIKTTNMLEKNAGENSSIFKALLLGDKSNISEEIYDSYKFTGLAHILSISGLHVGFIAVLFVWLLKKFRLSTKVQFISLFIFLLFYCFLCGFSSSVLRASIMSLCFMLSRVFGEQSDSLSSLSLAGIILISTNPLCILNAGFQLSFLSVGGILFLYRTFHKVFQKIKLPEFINSSFSVTLSATIFTLPITANIFGYISPITLIANLLILPIFSILFSILFVIFLISIILPTGFLFYPISYLFSAINAIIAVLGNISTISLTKLNLLSSLLYYIGLFIFSSFALLKNKQKIICSVCCFVLCVSTLLVYLTDFSAPNDKIILMKNVENTFVIQTIEKENILVFLGTNSDYDYRTLCNNLFDEKINKLSAIYLPNYTIDQNPTIINLTKKYNPSKILLSQDDIDNCLLLYSSLKNNGLIEFVDFDNLTITNNINFYSIKTNGYLKAIKINYINLNNPDFDSNFIQIVGNLSSNQANYIANQISSNNNYLSANNYSVGLETLLNSSNTFKSFYINQYYYLSKTEIEYFEDNNVLITRNNVVTFSQQ